jgi:hypothetical protein
MKLDGATIAIEPRSLGGCIDLAACFYRRHWRPILTLTVIVAAPVSLLGYFLAATTDAGLAWCAGLFVLFSPALGALLVAGAGYRVFGDPFAAGRALKVVHSRFPRLLGHLMGTWLWIALCVYFILRGGDAALTFLSWLILPLVALLAAQRGFLPEVILLEELRGGRLRRRIAEIMRYVHFALLVRRVALGVFVAGAVLGLFILLDRGAGVLLGLPIVGGRISAGPPFIYLKEFYDLVFYDPVATTALFATAWLVYPLARLAWFFCYLDVRIRKECWDVELDFRIEARRLESRP